MVLYFSGTGNSEYVANQIGAMLQDHVINLFEKIRARDTSAIHSDRPWVVVAPTYAWRIPRILHAWLRQTELSGSRDIYFVLTCGGSAGNAGAYLKKLCDQKSLHDRGCASIVMPENYIALFTTPTQEEALTTIQQAEEKIADAAQRIRCGEVLPQAPLTGMDHLNSGIVNDIFYPIFVHAKKFYATDACVSCALCTAVCPLNNIRMEAGKPVWGRACTHCMACICRCPSRAIEYGARTRGMARYTCPK